jgi:hypothetical protein
MTAKTVWAGGYMKQQYEHIALINGMDSIDITCVLRKTMVFWMGTPSARKEREARELLASIMCLREDYGVLFTSCKIALNFKKLTPVEFTEYNNSFSRMGGSVINCGRRKKAKFLAAYDRQIERKIRALNRQSHTTFEQIIHIMEAQGFGN